MRYYEALKEIRASDIEERTGWSGNTYWYSPSLGREIHYKIKGRYYISDAVGAFPETVPETILEESFPGEMPRYIFSMVKEREDAIQRKYPQWKVESSYGNNSDYWDGKEYHEGSGYHICIYRMVRNNTYRIWDKNPNADMIIFKKN